MKADIIIFAMFAQASLYSSSTGKPDTALFFLPTPEPAKNVNIILLWYRNNIFCELKVEIIYSRCATGTLNGDCGEAILVGDRRTTPFHWLFVVCLSTGLMTEVTAT